MQRRRLPVTTLVDYLAQIGTGTCPITDDDIAAARDEDEQQVLTGLLFLHEELELRRVRQEEAEIALRRANEELELQVLARTDALQKSQDQLAHAQKMDAVGRLSGAIAHDFNNLLCVVLSYSTSILEELPQADPLRVDIQEIATAATRASELTRQLLTFSRRQVVQPKVVDLDDTITRLDRMMQRLIGADVALAFHRSPSPAHVEIDPSQLEQVLVNLIVNARDAMPEGGTLTVETRERVLDAAEAARLHDVSPGAYVELVVTDTGTGMSRETMGRIFEPFFTTKEVGKGTGLGLATVFGIVRQSGGHALVDSRLGHGSRFTMRFPRAPAPVLAPGPSRVPPARDASGSETILLVEDEPQLRVVLRDILRRCGYRVYEAADGHEAERLFEEHGAAIGLLLTDVILPNNTSGPQIAERITSLRPGTRVLFMSGYTGDKLKGSQQAFLQKPITARALTSKVREVLDAET